MISIFAMSTRFRPARCAHLFAAVIAWVILTVAGGVNATEISARSASLTDISAAITLAQDGDVVNVPAGTATWTATLNITKNITVSGAGAASTIIVNGITGGSGRPPLVSIKLARNLPFRMSGFTFRGGVATAKDSNGEIRIAGVSHSFRIDHCTFDGLYGTSLSVAGFLWGVVDHNLFNCLQGRSSGAVEVKHKDWNGYDRGHGSWADDPYWGSEKFVFIEDNRIEFGGIGTIDSFEGARFVVRHNYIHNCGLEMHGSGGQGRSAKQVEEYNNIYVFDAAGTAGEIRGGTIISHDNTWTNVARGHILQDFRYYSGQDTYWGIANGQNVYDLNAPNGTASYWVAGTHTGPNGADSLTDATKNWTTNQWYTPTLGVAYIIRNKTKEAAGIPAQQSWTLGNSSNTVTFSHVTFPGKLPLAFDTGDRYEIWKIDRTFDQIGAGKGDLLTGAGPYGSTTMATPKAWPNQAIEPCYSWNNKDNNGKLLNLGAGQGTIKEGRDFFNNTPKPGYTPYTYPHPLTGPLPPTNLQIAAQP